jgi:hypothetical protein
MTGPRLRDTEFFNAMDLSRDDLQGVKVADDAQDWDGAKKAFAGHLRNRQRPLWFSDWRNRSEPQDRDAEVELVRVGDRAIRNVDLDFADRIVANVLTSCRVEQDFGTEINWELDPINYKEWTWQLSRHPFWVTLGQAYWKTADEKYARAFVRQLRHWIGHVLVPVAEDGNRWKTDAKMGTDQTNCWRTIECGIRMGQTWPSAFYYFLSLPSFTDEDVCLMVQSMVEHARHLTLWPRGGNWQTMQANGQYHVGVLFPEFKESQAWCDLAIQSLYAELDEQVYPDGAQIELSSGYHQVSLRNFVMAYAIGHLNNVPIPDDFVTKLERMYHYDLFMAMPNFLMPALNDGGQTDVRTYLRGGFKFFPDRTDFLWAASDRQEGTVPDNVSSAFPYAGHFVMRSGWDEQDRYLFFNGGPFGYGHQHEDKLNIMIYARGRVPIVDPGNYPYDSSQWRTYVLSTRAHNTVMVDGMEQDQRGKSREEYVVSEPLPHTWVLQKTHDYVSASYDLGYGPDRDTTVTHTRSILFVKPDFWIVTDFLSPSDEATHTYEGIFHLDADGAGLVMNGSGVETRNADGQSNFGIYCIANREFSCEVVSGQEEPTVQGWIPRGKPYECQPIPTPIFKSAGSGMVAMCYVLYPIEAGERSPVTAVTQISVKADCPHAAIAGRITMQGGGEVVFVQSEKGAGWVRGDEGETDAEAEVKVFGGDGKMDRLIRVSHTTTH